jgi:hypothetical protein
MRRHICFILIYTVFPTLLLPIGLLADDNPPSSEDNPPARVARISYLKGNVSFLRAGVDQWSQAAVNFPASTGDRIYTDKDSRAELEIGPYTVRLSENTDLTITNLNDEIMQLGLEQGTLRTSIYQFSSSDKVEVDSPNGAITLQEAGHYRVAVAEEGDHTIVSVDQGSAEITGGDVSQTLRSGEAARLTGQDPIQVESVPMPSPDDFDQWSEERDQHVADSGSTKYVSPGTTGFDDLDDHGHWEEVAEYGPIWYPAAVPVGWIPYRFGHWVWVNPWGWTWVEDEPWGFGPFHYGRWVLIGGVWGWLPGPLVATPVYAPALVAFLGGSSFSIGVGLTAWFPLGPGEPYLPWYHHSADYLRAVNVTNIRNVTDITKITNITNITNVHYAYREVATTAVRAEVFSAGRSVAHEVVKIDRQQLARAQVIPHPSANPTAHAVIPGKPVPSPSIRRKPLAVANRIPSGSPHPVSRSPIVRPPSTSPPGLVMRNTPPPPRVPFAKENHGMLVHPGRPLEPHQIENLRFGRPAGPMLDREFPPHPVARIAPPVRMPPAHHRP